MSTKIKLSKYDELLSQVQSEALKIKGLKESISEFEHRAKDIVPRLFFALTEEGLSAMDAKDRIEKDCVGVWKKGTIRDALPKEAKDQVKARAGKIGRKIQLEAMKHAEEERLRLEEEQRNKPTIAPTISGNELMMSNERLGEVGEDTFDKFYGTKSDVFEHDNAQIPREDIYQDNSRSLDKNLIADIVTLKKENTALKKKNDDLMAINKKLEHSIDILVEDLSKMREDRDRYKALYEKSKKDH